MQNETALITGENNFKFPVKITTNRSNRKYTQIFISAL